MKRRSLTLLIAVAIVGLGLRVSYTQGPLTNAMNLLVRSDSAGSLMVTSAVVSGATGPLTSFGNIRLKTDSNGYLIVAMNGGDGSVPTGVAPGSVLASNGVAAQGVWSASPTLTSILVGDGTVATPSLTFSSASTWGIYRDITYGIGFTIGGTEGAAVGTDGLHLRNAGLLSWSSTGVVGGVEDTVLARGAANVIGFGGATASFPALKRTGTTLAVRLADDSGNASLTAQFVSVGSGMAVANVGASSCGTTAATIAGNNNASVTTVGATAGTQCRIAFTLAATTEWDCAANDDTTTVAVRTTPVDTTHTDLIGTFTAGDKVTAICFPR